MIREHVFNAEGVSINYAESPNDCPPLLFLHGLTGDWQHIRHVLPHFTSDWHVFASDMRGHGRSAHAPDYRWTDFAEDNLALLRQRIGEPAVLVGTSLGANVAVIIAAKAPELVRAIVLEDPTIFDPEAPEIQKVLPEFEIVAELARDQRPVEALRAEVARRRPELDEVAVRAKALRLHRLDPKAVELRLSGECTRGFEIGSAVIGCPTLLLRADPSVRRLCSDQGLRVARQQISDLSVVEVSGAGHVIRSTHPHEFVRLVTAFLDTI